MRHRRHYEKNPLNPILHMDSVTKEPVSAKSSFAYFRNPSRALRLDSEETPLRRYARVNSPPLSTTADPATLCTSRTATPPTNSETSNKSHNSSRLAAKNDANTMCAQIDITVLAFGRKPYMRKVSYTNLDFQTNIPRPSPIEEEDTAIVRPAIAAISNAFFLAACSRFSKSSFTVLSISAGLSNAD